MITSQIANYPRRILSRWRGLPCGTTFLLLLVPLSSNDLDVLPLIGRSYDFNLATSCKHTLSFITDSQYD